MALTCSKILDLPYANKLKFIAGKTAATNRIRWVHYLEDPAYVKWLKGGELIIISGSVIKDNKKELIHLLEALYDYNVAGVIINLSDYIKKIPDEVIKEANELELPLFEMAAEIRIVDISQSICYAIFQNQQMDQQNSNAILEIIYGQRITERRIERIKNIGIVDGIHYRMIAVRAKAVTGKEIKKAELYDDDSSQQMVKSLEQLIMHRLKEHSVHICYIQDDDALIIFIKDKNYADIKRELIDLHHDIKKNISNIQVTIAIGSIFENIRDIKNCYEITHRMLELSEQDGIIDDYENIIKKLAEGYPDREDIRQSVSYTLQPLIKEENKELLDTLIMYLRCSQSVKETAKNMYVHTNTIHYRISKVQELLGFSFHEYEKFLQLQICLEIYQLWNGTK